jgi:rod shape-determining protein MreC
VAKGSVGLGLTTRQMSISSLNDRKKGKSFGIFLCLSLVLLLSNVVAKDYADKAKHVLADYSLVIMDQFTQPIEMASLQIARIKSLWDIQKNNEMLAEENQRLLDWYLAANRLDEENKALRDLLNMKDDDAVRYLSGKVISDSATQYSHTILVRLGENDGVTKGQGVLSQEGLIGRIIETGRETSRILLMTDVNSRIPVTVEGTQDRAILAGVNSGDPVLDHLSESHGVKAGQKVITSGHGGVFPFGVAVGETYINEAGFIAVRPYANPNRANYVQIVDYGVPAGSADRSVANASSSVLQ